MPPLLVFANRLYLKISINACHASRFLSHSHGLFYESNHKDYLYQQNKKNLNYLAHMQLSCSDDYLIVGNFLADMLDLHGQEKLPQAYQKGVALHRLIDTFTDQHSDVRAVNKLLHANHHKYAPVVSDVIFDFFLGKNWDLYDTRTLQPFCNMIYDVLTDHIHVAPSTTANIINRMIEDNFLLKYTSFEGLTFVFDKMSKRTRFESNFPKAIEDIQNFHDEINDRFNSFYPDIIMEVNQFCGCDGVNQTLPS